MNSIAATGFVTQPIWPVTVQLLILGAVQKLSGFMIMAAVALGAGTFGTWLARRPSPIA